MTCIECRQQLEQSFGQTQLEVTLDEHLRVCNECRNYWQQLARLAEGIPDDRSFAFDDDTINKLVQTVDETINQSTGTIPMARRGSREASPWTLMKLLPAAAAVLLVVGVGFGGYFVGRTNLDPGKLTIDNPAPTVLSSTNVSDYDEPDRLTFEVLLSDFATDRPYDASEKLLDDITDEEMEYFAQNFDVGDLL